MAEHAESKKPAPGDETEQLEKLQSRVEKLCVDIDNEVDSDLPGRDDLARISEVLKVIKGKIKPTEGGGGGGGDGAASKEEQLLPRSKREELVNLLPSIEHTLAFQLQQRKEKATREQGEGESMFRAAGIAGVHGSGKTALAQKVFVHDKAKDNFAIRLWVCVGPPDSEDRFGLLYRMLDNLGLDTYKVEDIVDNSNAVKPHREKAEARIRSDAARFASIKEAAQRKAQEEQKKPDDGDAKEDTKQEGQAAYDSILSQLLKEAADESPDVQKSKIGVLLYILHMTLSKTSYMIVFDDIRAYGDDGWYNNLALAPPPEGEWGDRLGYGLPKGSHRGAVLVTCRNEDHARSMARTGRVVRPPRLRLDDAWKLFRREYDQAKEAKRGKNKKGDGKNDGGDNLLKDLEQMKVQIVDKCLGLPVAIAEAAKGYADLEPLPDNAPPRQAADANKHAAVVDQAASGSSKEDTQQPAAPAAGGGES